MIFQPFKQAREADTPNLIQAELQRRQAKEREANIRSKNIAEGIGALGDYNAYMDKQGKTPIADALRRMGTMQGQDPMTPVEQATTPIPPPEMATAYPAPQMAPGPAAADTLSGALRGTGGAPADGGSGLFAPSSVGAGTAGGAAGNAPGTEIDAVTGAADDAASVYDSADELAGTVDAADAATDAADVAGDAGDAFGATDALGYAGAAKAAIEGDPAELAKQLALKQLAALGPYGAGLAMILSFV